VFSSRWVKAAIIAAGCLVAGTAQGALYVYELPDGSRMVTDYPMNNRHYRLVRTGAGPKHIGRLAAYQDPRLFRSDPATFDPLIRRVAAEHQVDFALVKAVMHVESAFNPYARSHKGALGLMQLMPATAAQYGVEDVYDPVQNLIGGVKHLRYLLQRFNHERSLALAAYNAGEAAVRRYRGIPPYPETRAYVRKVLKYAQEYARAAAPPAPARAVRTADRDAVAAARPSGRSG